MTMLAFWIGVVIGCVATLSMALVLGGEARKRAERRANQSRLDRLTRNVQGCVPREVYLDTWPRRGAGQVVGLRRCEGRRLWS